MTEPERRAVSGRIAPLSDPAETVERLVPRRQLLLQDGDVLIVRTPGGIGTTFQRWVYELRVRGQGPLGERFASSENAMGRGDQIAQQQQVRLMLIETRDGPPHLLRDYRPK